MLCYMNDAWYMYVHYSMWIKIPPCHVLYLFPMHNGKEIKHGNHLLRARRALTLYQVELAPFWLLAN